MFRSVRRAAPVLHFQLVIVGILAIALSGCAKKGSTTEPASASDGEESLEGKNPNVANVRIGPKIAEACGISESEAYFAYNSSQLSGSAASLLEKLVTCFTTGPLAGRSMNLVGHADPRGDEEYNMVLGGKRADSVVSALVNKGLDESQAQSSSRGELEAKGTDEASWAKDRRVEVYLVE